MRYFAGVLSCLLAVSASPVFAQQTGVAYDEVIEEYTTTPLPLPKDFAKVYADNANAAGASHRQVVHIAFLGTSRRTELPDGTVIIDRPDLGKYLHLNPAAKTYWTTPWMPRETYSVPAQPTPAPNAPQTVAQLESVHDAWPTQTYEGRSVRGETVRAVLAVTPTATCHIAQTVAMITIFSTDSIQESEFSGDLYGAPLNFAPVELSRISGCTVSAPDLTKAFPTYPGFIIYRASRMGSANRDVRLAELPAGLPTALIMRGNIRTITGADKSLFEVPASYKLVPVPK